MFLIRSEYKTTIIPSNNSPPAVWLKKPIGLKLPSGKVKPSILPEPINSRTKAITIKITDIITGAGKQVITFSFRLSQLKSKTTFKTISDIETKQAMFTIRERYPLNIREKIRDKTKGIAIHSTKFKRVLYVEFFIYLCVEKIVMFAKICTIIRETITKRVSNRLFEGIIKGINDKNMLFISF